MAGTANENEIAFPTNLCRVFTAIKFELRMVSLGNSKFKLLHFKGMKGLLYRVRYESEE